MPSWLPAATAAARWVREGPAGACPGGRPGWPRGPTPCPRRRGQGPGTGPEPTSMQAVSPQPVGPPFEGGFGLVHPSRSSHGAPVSVMTGPPMTRPPRPGWPLSSVLPPMGALATAPRTARMHLRDTLKEWGLPELIEDGELIASELVTNVVKRAHDPVTGRPVYVSDRLPVLQFGLFSD